jgi:hypothetical protein
LKFKKHNKKRPKAKAVMVNPIGASIPSSVKPFSSIVEEEPQEVSPNTYTPQDYLITKRAPVVDFGKSTNKRSFKPTVDATPSLPAYNVPGPGADSSKTPMKGIGTSSFVSKSKKNFQATSETSSPGPGAYEAGYGLSDKVPYNYNPIYERSPPRRDEWRNDYEVPYTSPSRAMVPPVGAYSPGLVVHSNSEPKKKRLPSFGSTQAKHSFSKELSPGPSHYSPSEPLPLNHRRPVGSVAPRVSEFDVIQEVPGPGAYDIRQVRPVLRKYSVFESSTSRFLNPKTSSHDHNLSLEQWKPHTNRSADFGPYSKHPSFNSVAPRRTEEFFSVPESPGPGRYSPPLKAPTGPKFDHSRRFGTFGNFLKKPVTSEDLGPGAYSTTESMVKKSFNSVIETSMSGN